MLKSAGHSYSWSSSTRFARSEQASESSKASFFLLFYEVEEP